MTLNAQTSLVISGIKYTVESHHTLQHINAILFVSVDMMSINASSDDKNAVSPMLWSQHIFTMSQSFPISIEGMMSLFYSMDSSSQIIC